MIDGRCVIDRANGDGSSASGFGSELVSNRIREQRLSERIGCGSNRNFVAIANLYVAVIYGRYSSELLRRS